MKLVVVLVYLLFVISYSNSAGLFERIVIHTTDQHDTKYQFFPLRTNHLQFWVKATNDVHVCLTNMPKLSPPWYEIAIGAWGNSKSVIRKDKPDHRVEYLAPILNQTEYQLIRVTIDDKKGTISVGKLEGGPFMQYTDPDYVKMSYFGISTGYGSNGEWNFDLRMFNCDCMNDDNEV